MFTGNRIQLSELAGPLGLDVRRDAQIAHVGKVPTRLEARLVPCGKPIHLDEAAGETGIAAYVVTADLADAVPEAAGLVVAERPVVTAMAIHEHLAGLPGFLWKDFDSEIDPTAVIMPGAHVAARNVRIGARTVVGPNAVILERSIIGADCEIGPGTVVGGEAFEQSPGASPKRILKQGGGVWIEDWVTITACSEISGRVEIGDDAYLGPNCTISNGVRIGNKATVTIGSVVVRDVPEGARVTGNFALPHESWLKLIRDYR